MWKLDIGSDFNIILTDCENNNETVLFTDEDSNDSPVDVAVQYLNRKGIMIGYYSIDSDLSVVLLSDKN